jgi:hypothetical protein
MFDRKKVYKSTFKLVAERKLNRKCDIIVGSYQIQTRLICVLTDYRNNARIFQILVYLDCLDIPKHFLVLSPSGS